MHSKNSKFKSELLLLTAIMIFLTTFSSTSATVSASAAGATFPAPFIGVTMAAFDSANPGYQLSYSAIGSGAGQTHLFNKDLPFVGSDAPLSDTQRTAHHGVEHIPETIGSVTLSYNLQNATHMSSNLRKGLNLTATVIAKIYLGNITTWNDPAIVSLNTAWSSFIPSTPITTVHRCDGSGTTFVFTSFLDMASTNFGNGLGNGTTVAWGSKGTPTGVCGNGNAGVASQVTANHNYIGYVELNYALSNNLAYASINNALGQFIAPSLDSTKLAVTAGSGSLPTGDQSWAHVSLLNESAAGAYPIASFTYFMLYKELNVTAGIDAQVANLVVAYIWFHVHLSPGGQDLANSLSYVQLPANVITINENTLNSITYNGVVVSHTPSGGTPAPPNALPYELLALVLGLVVVIVVVVVARRKTNAT